MQKTEGLKCGPIDIGAIGITSKAMLVGKEVAILNLGRSGVEENIGYTDRPLITAGVGFSGRRNGDLWPNSKAHSWVSYIDQASSKDVQIPQTSSGVEI